MRLFLHAFLILWMAACASGQASSVHSVPTASWNPHPESVCIYLYAHGNPVNGTDPSGHFNVSDVMAAVGAMYSTATFYLAPAINVGRVVGTVLLGALIVSDQEFAREFAAVYVSSGGNPGGLASHVVGEVRTLRAALVAQRAFRASSRIFTAVEQAIVTEAKQIMGSAQFAEIKAAQQAGNTVRVTINGRTIQYQSGLPFSGMTWKDANGFIISDEALTSEAELAKTIAHELHRLTTSASLGSGTISGAATSRETRSAFEFAEKAAEDLLK